jgi:hypothetical protein
MGVDAPSAFRARLDEQVFGAVIPGRRIDDMARCHGITSDG